MTRPKGPATLTAPYWKVRVVIRGGVILHLASKEEPVVTLEANGRPVVAANWLNDWQCGDTAGYVDWAEVVAVTWRWTGDGADGGDR